MADSVVSTVPLPTLHAVTSEVNLAQSAAALARSPSMPVRLVRKISSGFMSRRGSEREIEAEPKPATALSVFLRPRRVLSFSALPSKEAATIESRLESVLEGPPVLPELALPSVSLFGPQTKSAEEAPVTGSPKIRPAPRRVQTSPRIPSIHFSALEFLTLDTEAWVGVDMKKKDSSSSGAVVSPTKLAFQMQVQLRRSRSRRKSGGRNLTPPPEEGSGSKRSTPTNRSPKQSLKEAAAAANPSTAPLPTQASEEVSTSLTRRPSLKAATAATKRTRVPFALPALLALAMPSRPLRKRKPVPQSHSASSGTSTSPETSPISPNSPTFARFKAATASRANSPRSSARKSKSPPRNTRARGSPKRSMFPLNRSSPTPRKPISVPLSIPVSPTPRGNSKRLNSGTKDKRKSRAMSVLSTLSVYSRASFDGEQVTTSPLGFGFGRGGDKKASQEKKGGGEESWEETKLPSLSHPVVDGHIGKLSAKKEPVTYVRSSARRKEISKQLEDYYFGSEYTSEFGGFGTPTHNMKELEVDAPLSASLPSRRPSVSRTATSPSVLSTFKVQPLPAAPNPPAESKPLPSTPAPLRRTSSANAIPTRKQPPISYVTRVAGSGSLPNRKVGLPSSPKDSGKFKIAPLAPRPTSPPTMIQTPASPAPPRPVRLRPPLLTTSLVNAISTPPKVNTTSLKPLKSSPASTSTPSPVTPTQTASTSPTSTVVNSSSSSLVPLKKPVEPLLARRLTGTRNSSTTSVDLVRNGSLSHSVRSLRSDISSPRASMISRSASSAGTAVDSMTLKGLGLGLGTGPMGRSTTSVASYVVCTEEPTETMARVKLPVIEKKAKITWTGWKF